jgi:hypothetical protein
MDLILGSPKFSRIGIFGLKICILSGNPGDSSMKRHKMKKTEAQRFFAGQRFLATQRLTNRPQGVTSIILSMYIRTYMLFTDYLGRNMTF